jgi:hypothetical protein
MAAVLVEINFSLQKLVRKCNTYRSTPFIKNSPPPP